MFSFVMLPPQVPQPMLDVRFNARNFFAPERDSLNRNQFGGTLGAPLIKNYSWVSHFDQSRFDQKVHRTVYPQAPAGQMFPGDSGYPGDATTFGKMAQFAPRVGMVWTPGGDEKTSVRASWGVFYDTPHLRLPAG